MKNGEDKKKNKTTNQKKKQNTLNLDQRIKRIKEEEIKRKKNKLDRASSLKKKNRRQTRK